MSTREPASVAITILPTLGELLNGDTAALRNDEGNYTWLTALHGWQMRYAHGRGWLCWNKKRWYEDKDAAATRFARNAMLERLSAVGVITDEKARAKEAAWVSSSLSDAKLASLLSYASKLDPFAVRPDDFDADPRVLNMENGILDLRTGELRDHDPAAMHSKLAPVEYIPGAECPRWHQFLEEIFDGNSDLSDFLRRAIGYSLTGDTREQCLFVLHGGGANGKTTLLNVVKRLLGDYQQNAEFATFSYAREAQAGVRDDLAALAGARLVTASEAAVGMRFSEGIVKQLTGGDPVTARHLYQRKFDFTPQFKLWLSCNHRPTVRDSSEAFWRRVHLIPFDVSFRGREDHELPAKLGAELPGILAWAVLGCLEWQRDGLNPPDAVKAATASYREEEDVIGSFLAEKTVAEPAAFTPTRRLSEAYLQWCDDNTEKPLSTHAFGQALTEHGFLADRRHVGRVRLGLRFREERDA